MHAQLWTETIVAVGGRPRPTSDTYQARYAAAIGAPTSLLEVLALTQVFERGVYRHFVRHLRRPGHASMRAGDAASDARRRARPSLVGAGVARRVRPDARRTAIPVLDAPLHGRRRGHPRAVAARLRVGRSSHARPDGTRAARARGRIRRTASRCRARSTIVCTSRRCARIRFSRSRRSPPAADDSLVVVGSGGCTALSLLAAGAGHVAAVDLNRSQNHLIELKLAALTSLPREALLGVLGATRSGRAPTASTRTRRSELDSDADRARVLGRTSLDDRARRARTPA